MIKYGDGGAARSSDLGHDAPQRAEPAGDDDRLSLHLGLASRQAAATAPKPIAGKRLATTARIINRRCRR
jgi:hypothetical protein